MPEADPRPRPTGAGTARIAPTAARAMRIIELLAADPTGALTLAELQRRLDYSHGNLHAICTTLVALGYLRRDPDERGYRLGPALVTAGHAARDAYPTVDAALPHLTRLADRFGTEAHAAGLVGGSILVVARVGPVVARHGVHVGQRFPLTPPLGSTFLAWATTVEVEAYLASAAGTLSDAEIERCRLGMVGTRERGYSVHLEVESSRHLSVTAEAIRAGGSAPESDDELVPLAAELGRQGYMPTGLEAIHVGRLVQISAPVFGPDGRVTLSVGLVVVAAADGPAAVTDAAAHAVAAAREVTDAIGGRPPGAA